MYFHCICPTVSALSSFVTTSAPQLLQNCNQFVLCSLEVQEFFCLNDPPGPYDSLEESRVSSELLMYLK